jgi:hypothetical protein
LIEMTQMGQNGSSNERAGCSPQRVHIVLLERTQGRVGYALEARVALGRLAKRSPCPRVQLRLPRRLEREDDCLPLVVRRLRLHLQVPRHTHVPLLPHAARRLRRLRFRNLANMTNPLNREQRRAEEFGRDHPEHNDATAAQQEKKLIEDATPQDVTSVRAKNMGKGKKTADKWNQ